MIPRQIATEFRADASGDERQLHLDEFGAAYQCLSMSVTGSRQCSTREVADDLKDVGVLLAIVAVAPGFDLSKRQSGVNANLHAIWESQTNRFE